MSPLKHDDSPLLAMPQFPHLGSVILPTDSPTEWEEGGAQTIRKFHWVAKPRRNHTGPQFSLWSMEGLRESQRLNPHMLLTVQLCLRVRVSWVSGLRVADLVI